MSAGESSGDALGARLLRALASQEPEIEAFGMGGREMRSAGLDARHDVGELNVMGFVEVLRSLPRILRLRDSLVAHAARRRPDVAVLIDSPDFHARVAKRLRRMGVPIVWYVGPTIWAWRPWRARSFSRFVDRMMVLFPFEVDAWTKAGVDVVCVGHPLFDEIASPNEPRALHARTLAILPGSRPCEIRRHLAVALDAAATLKRTGAIDHVVLPVAPALDPSPFVRAIDRFGDLRESVELVIDTGDGSKRRRAIQRSDLAFVASGTATLEAALLGCPEVVFYRVHPLSHFLGRWLVKTPFFSLPNLMLGREVVCELIQGAFDAEALVSRGRAILEDSHARERARDVSCALRRRSGALDAAECAALAVLDIARRRA